MDKSSNHSPGISKSALSNPTLETPSSRGLSRQKQVINKLSTSYQQVINNFLKHEKRLQMGNLESKNRVIHKKPRRLLLLYYIYIFIYNNRRTPFSKKNHCLVLIQNPTPKRDLFFGVELINLLQLHFFVF